MTIILARPEVLVDQLAMPEAPRWHRGEFYFSDVWAGRVHKLDARGRIERVAEFPGEHVSGLGFLPDGDLLAVLMNSRRIAQVAQGQTAIRADLKPLTEFHINDMVVHGSRAYISQPGFDMNRNPIEPRTTDIILVDADGSVGIAASGLHCPNGLAVSADGATLFVAESSAGRITTFAIAANGSLSDQSVFAQLPDGGIPDGICLDTEGGVWMGVPVALTQIEGFGFGVQRIVAGGTVTHRVPVDPGRRALACVFGGDDRRSLYICTATAVHPEQALAQQGGRVERITLNFQGVGLP
jgi:sugar lactone lactonase YvrE